MEPFFDGGLFEVLIVLLLGGAMNFIFLRKYLLAGYSIISIFSPIALFFTAKGDLHYIIISICVLNSILLTILLWRQRKTDSGTPLFDIKTIVASLFKKSASDAKKTDT